MAGTSCASTSNGSPISTSTTRRWSRGRHGLIPAGTIWLALSDGAEEALDPKTLTVDGAGVLRAWVHAGRLEARLATSAVAALGDLLTEMPDGRPALRGAGQRMPIPARPGG